MTDLQLIEIGEGGDLVLQGNDLAKVGGYETAVYLALFGGDAWVFNYLAPKRPYASKTQAALRNNPLTSAGRLAIEKAVIADLEFLKNIPGVSYSVSVRIVSKDTVQIDVNFNGQLFTYNVNQNDAMPVRVCAMVTGLASGTITPNSIEFSWDSAPVVGYEWFITTTIVEPTGTGTFTATPLVNITGLTDMTTYYFWARSVCSGGSVSAFVLVIAQTSSAIPVTTGLRGLYAASAVHIITGKVTKWEDLSGYNNHLLPTSTPILTVAEDEFGTQDAVVFDGVGSLATLADFVGLTGSDKITVFVVKKRTTSFAGECLMMYALTNDAIINDGFSMWQSLSGPTTYDHFDAKGNVGSNSASVNAAIGTHIYSVVADKSQTAANEVKLKLDKVTTGTGSGSNNTGPNYGSYKLTVGVTSNLTTGHFSGKVGCIAIYTGALSSGDVDSITDYLMAKYSI